MEETVETDALERTLKSLLDTAENTDPLAKGGVENSGTYGSGGHQGGGQGDGSCPIDNMMIAKMIQSGVDVQTAAKFAAFMSGEEEEDDDDDDNNMDKGNFSEQEPMGKSFREALEDHLEPSESDMVNVTPYLDGLTSALGEQLDGLHKSVQSGQSQQGRVNKSMAAAVHQMGSLLKSQATLINALGQRLGLVERTPASAPKGVTGTAAPLNKSMPREVGAGNIQLTKSNTLSTLTYMNLNKGMSQINGVSTSDLITGLEAGDVFDERTHGAVQDFLKSCTTEERKEALNPS